MQTKIIYFIANSDFSGGPIQLFNLVQNLDQQRYKIVVVCPTGFLSKELKRKNIEVVNFSYKKGPLAGNRFKKIIKPLIEENTILNPHGVVAGRFAKDLNKTLKLPLVYTEHNWTQDYSLPQKWRKNLQLNLLKKQSKYVTHTVCVSNAVRDFLLLKGITTKEKSSVIYNGVKFDQIDNYRNKFDPLVIGTIASMHKRKGLIFLFEALARFQKEKKQKFLLKIIGVGPEQKFLKEHAVSLGINFNIRWLGVRQNLSEFWNGISVYIQPSLDESFGMAVAEAMGYKIPVIATTAGALPEVVGDAGLLVEPANSNDLVKAIENVVSNKTIREDNVEKGYKRVVRMFSIERMAKEYEELYSKIEHSQQK